jgi:hypothetical protein
MIHAAGAALLIAIVYGNQSITWTMAMIFAALLLGYARPDFTNLRRDGCRKTLGLFVIRFAVNSAFVWGGLLGGSKCGALCIFPPIHTRVVAGGPTAPERIQNESVASVVKAVELSS